MEHPAALHFGRGVVRLGPPEDAGASCARMGPWPVDKRVEVVLEHPFVEARRSHRIPHGLFGPVRFVREGRGDVQMDMEAPARKPDALTGWNVQRQG